MTRLVTLCQDCLRLYVHQTEAERAAAHAEEFMCECGGQLCGCDSCVWVIEALERGERGTLNGNIPKGVYQWTPERGCK